MCNSDGSVNQLCDKSSGNCECLPFVDGLKCSKCQDGYYGFPECQGTWKMNRVQMIMRNLILSCYWFSACECNEDGSHDITCDDDTGVCNCRDNITNDKCDQCTSGFFGFPTCEGK